MPPCQSCFGKRLWVPTHEAHIAADVLGDATDQRQGTVLLVKRGAEVSLGISPTLNVFCCSLDIHRRVLSVARVQVSCTSTACFASSTAGKLVPHLCHFAVHCRSGQCTKLCHAMPILHVDSCCKLELAVSKLSFSLCLHAAALSGILLAHRGRAIRAVNDVVPQ